MKPRPTIPFPPLLFMLAFIMSGITFSNAQDSTSHFIQDTTTIQKPTLSNSTFRRLLPHWNLDVKKSDGPTAVGVIIRTNPITWAAYYSYEYILRNVFWVPGS